jgi:hypothetical protein
MLGQHTQASHLLTAAPSGCCSTSRTLAQLILMLPHQLQGPTVPVPPHWQQHLEQLQRSGERRVLQRYYATVQQINALEPSMQALSDEDLRQVTVNLRDRLAGGEALDSLLPEAFAAVREASTRVLGLRHYDVQLVSVPVVELRPCMPAVATHLLRKMHKICLNRCITVQQSGTAQVLSMNPVQRPSPDLPPMPTHHPPWLLPLTHPPTQPPDWRHGAARGCCG